jgi:hypothetical protein
VRERVCFLLSIFAAVVLTAHSASFEPVSPTESTPTAAREISTLPQPGAAFTAPLFGLDDPSLTSPHHPSGAGAAAGGGPLPVALVLIDRSLDLATPCSASDHFLDGTVSLLQRRPPAPAPPHAAPGRWAEHRWAWGGARVWSWA